MVKPQCGVLSKGSMSIGDTVGFEHNGDKIIGKVIKLNPKTVKLITSANTRWNVPYKYLFAVIDAELNIIDIPMISNSVVAK
jgi:phage gp45-like